MSYLVLARKHRPQTFDQVVKQNHVTQTLLNAISSDHVAHAILFSGPRGTGKTTVARILAKAMNCIDGPTPKPCNVCRSCKEITASGASDVFEIDGASNNSVDQIRDLRDNIRYMPVHSLYKIYIIDEVHMLSIAAFNALLKTLEEPPPHVLFLFATTEPHKIPITILSRCQRHDFRRIDIKSISEYMAEICEKEKVTIPTESLWRIAREADGSMRDALSLLDQVISGSKEDISHDQLLDMLGIVERKIFFDLSDAVFKGDVHSLLDTIDEIYRRGYDMKKLFSDLIEHFRNLWLVGWGKNISKLVDLPLHEVDLIRKQIKDTPPSLLYQILDILYRQETHVKLAENPKLAVEITFIRLLQSKPTLPIDVLIQKLDTVMEYTHQSSSVPPDGLSSKKEHSIKDMEKKFPPASDLTLTTVTQKDEHDIVLKHPDTDLKGTWKRISNLLSEKFPSLTTVLNKSEIVKLTDKKINILINGNGFELNMIQRKKILTALEKILFNIFQKPMKVDISGKKISTDDRNSRSERIKDLQNKALNHPLVAQAIEIFNCKVVDVKILEEVS